MKIKLNLWYVRDINHLQIFNVCIKKFMQVKGFVKIEIKDLNCLNIEPKPKWKSSGCLRRPENLT